MIRALLFDLDGTLFDRDSTVRSIVEAQYAAFSRELAHVTKADFVTRVVLLDEHGYRNKAEVYATIAGEFHLPPPLAPELTADFWRRYHASCRPFHDLVATLEELRRRGKMIVSTRVSPRCDNRRSDSASTFRTSGARVAA